MATKKKSTRKKKTADPSTNEEAQQETPPLTCAAPRCNAPPFPDSQFCLSHTATSMVMDFAERKLRRGNASGLLGAAGALIAQNPNVMNAAANTIAQILGGGARPRPTPAPEPPKLDPFVYLGLDRTQATPEDVKRIQRELAKIYHPDRMGSAVAAAKMQEVNQAVEAALESLRRRG